MTLREVKYLVDSYEFQNLTNKFNLMTRVFGNEKIFLLSECFVFEIYGLVVEDFFYFDIYSVDLNFYSNIDRLLSDFDSRRIQSVYQSELVNRKQVAIPFLQGNKVNTLKAEQYFFTMLQLMGELLSDILSCQREIKKEHWSETFEVKKKQLKIVFEGLK
jgi:hypothetical protein